MSDDRRWMSVALSLARRGLGQVWPNPAVGCVIVKDGRVLGRGWTQPGGRPHAEAMALSQASGRAQGATAYVTLEPCAHHGRTPPCADALAAAGVVRVVTSFEDPDPRVSGKGLAKLREAGVTVETGLMADEAEAINCGFLIRQRTGRPFVRLKLAATLDGRIATATGESQWITGPEARARVHMIRAEADAVMVGAGTARADDPRLDVRLPGLEDRSPVRVIVDPTASLSKQSKLIKGAAQTPVWICCTRSPEERPPGVEYLVIPSENGKMDLSALLQILGDKGLTRVFCEGGGVLAAGLLAAGLVDELVWASAGLALGADGLPGVASLPFDALADAPRFDMLRAEQVGADVLTTWRAQRHSQA